MNAKLPLAHLADGQADAVDTDIPLGQHIFHQLGGEAIPHLTVVGGVDHRGHFRHPDNVAGHGVTADLVTKAGGTLHVDLVPHLQLAEVGQA